MIKICKKSLSNDKICGGKLEFIDDCEFPYFKCDKCWTFNSVQNPTISQTFKVVPISICVCHLTESVKN